MRIRCKLGRHIAPSSYFRVWNDGFYFGECSACFRDLVKARGMRWRAVPKGYAIVWATQSQISARRDKRHAQLSGRPL